MAGDAGFRYLTIPASSPMDDFSPALRDWFRHAFPDPTLPQRYAWPAVKRGDNLLLAAPTGSGKTLAAFLPIIAELLADDDSRARGSERHNVRCLYVAPLKALGRDVGKNLRRYLRGLESFVPADTSLPRIGLRTGDTPEQVRRRQLDDPPDILLTTPESLSLLLARPDAPNFFAALRWVVVDEVHALASSKRGADLAVSLERLEQLAPRPLQRIGLSATCALAEMARFLVGVGRPCSVAEVQDISLLQVRVELLPESASFMTGLLERIDSELAETEATLIFTNTRSLAEKLTWALRRRHPRRPDKIAVHHSSLSQTRRRLVEHRLKQGKLRVVVTSASLELGIDIGSVDNVILVHPPGDVSRLLQRLGRSGHQPGGCRRGVVFTASRTELLQATVAADSGKLRQLDRLRVPEAPLDVLCQQLLGMAIGGSWSEAEACTLVRRAYPFRHLQECDFAACLAYLSGKDQLGRDWLTPRLGWHGDRFTIVDATTTKLVRRNLGTILSDDGRTVRLLQPTFPGERQATTLLGEVDERFAEELQPGDRFLLEGRCLEFRRQHRDGLLVEEVSGRPRTPRWPGVGWPMSPELARRIFLFRIEAAELLRQGPGCFEEYLRADYELDAVSIQALVELFTVQDSVSEIPDLNVVLVECVVGELGVACFFHTPLAGPANDAIARVLTYRLRRDRGTTATATSANLGLVIHLADAPMPSAQDWREVLRADGFEADVRAALRDAPCLRERFGRLATTSLMTLRNPLGGKRKVGGSDWASRRLFDLIRGHDPDFFLLRQAERELHSDVCAAQPARCWLLQAEHFPLRLRRLSEPSPFSADWSPEIAAPAQRAFV